MDSNKLKILLAILDSETRCEQTSSDFVNLNMAMAKNLVGGVKPSTNETCYQNPTCSNNEGCLGNGSCDANMSCSGNGTCGANKVCNSGCNP